MLNDPSQNGDPDARLDLEFYRSNNPDLADMSDEALRNHYRDYGFAEGRRPRADADRPDPGAFGADLPADFDPAEYARLNPDVAANSSSHWDLYRHYLVRGRIEERPYTELDPRFYWSMYLADTAYNLTRVMGHFAIHGQKPGHYRSLDAMLEAHNMPNGQWLKVFSERAFLLLNADWAPSHLTRAQAIALFLEQGIARGAQISFNDAFDVEFYRELHPHLHGLGDEAAYRYWLSTRLEHHEAATGASWMHSMGLHLPEFPRAFAWREYAIRHLAGEARPTRWQALQHLIGNLDLPASAWPLIEDGASEFLEAMGTCRKRQNRVDLSIECYERAQRFPHSSSLSHRLADAFHGQGQWSAALRLFDQCEAQGTRSLWSVVLHADAAIKLGLYDRAHEILLNGKPMFGGAQPWLTTVFQLVESFFEARTNSARALYSLDDPEQRRTADRLMTEAVDWIGAAWLDLLDQPVPVGPSSEGPVVILATKALKQCTHYRIEQKEILLDALGRPCKVFEFTEVDAFLAALPGASAAIFYRLPALPSVIRAILAARSQDIPTYYEIDDLVFDAENYPDPFESFQGQIDLAVYQGLLYGTPLYRAAMALCDFGIASTPTLVRAMERVVRKGEVALLRNGLDSRNLGLESLPSRPARSADSVRILYGSATLAHNQDFHDLAGPGLCAVLAENPGVELMIIGHLAMDRMFDPYLDRIVQVPLIADPVAYWSLLATADINLAVVAPGLMADGKSEIKWLEAAVLGVPSIVSATATYRDVIQPGRTGLLAANSDEWTDALRGLVGSPALRMSMGQAARAQALENYSVEAGVRALKRALAMPAPVKRKRKPRILLVNVYFPPQAVGGATRVIAGNLDDWLDAPASTGFDYAVATTDFDAVPAYRRRVDSYRGVPVFRIAPPLESDLDWKPTDPEMGEWFAEVLAQFEPDLVHFHCIQRLTATPLEVCQDAEIPYIVSVHDGWWLSDYQFLFDENASQRFPGDELVRGGRPGITMQETLSRLSRLRRGLDGAQAILAPSETFAALYRQAGFNTTAAVSNGVPVLKLEPRTPSQTPRVRLAHIGDVSPHKGFDLVEAALRLNDFPNLELMALSHAKPAGSLSQQTWGSTRVRIGGRVPQDQVHHIYGDIDVLLAPSACTESYGLVTREANAFGVWVVASDRGGIGEDVRRGVDGFVVDVSDARSLTSVLAHINADPDRFREPAPVNPNPRPAQAQAADLQKIYRRVVRASPVGVRTLKVGRPSTQRHW
ncbi:glycosyltransferase [Brevundimonas sp.]|uniref:glycosyltransferase n=1 Tax=Brevundimonas sp. TaxID=1871086 RepID=UPI001A35A228|nr:glycosyltransferase [Brevundimonas sp.]MBJ7485097.1 glycosyltransferase [Brevundimonas sp.]